LEESGQKSADCAEKGSKSSRMVRRLVLLDMGALGNGFLRVWQKMENLRTAR
jgi:hypothetical protein